MTTLETFARELADALYGANTEGPDPTFLRVCESYDIHLTDPCGYCHGDDGAHEQFCAAAMCVVCNVPGCPGDCADRAWDSWREERFAADDLAPLWVGEGGTYPEGEDA